MDIERVLVTEDEIIGCVERLGKMITEDYAGMEITVICVLKGAAVFMSDLIRCIKVPLEIDFVALSSYGSAMESSGVVTIRKDLDRDIKDKHVLIVEDIVDTGITLRFLKDELMRRHPASVKICAMLDKPSRRRTELTIDYLGMVIDDHFVIGYGLDFNERGRELPYIAVVKT